TGSAPRKIVLCRAIRAANHNRHKLRCTMTERYASSPPCPLCVGSESSALDEIQGRRFYSCVACGLVHVSPSDWLTPEAERAHYQLHENDPADVRYRRFLDRLVVPLLTHLQPG